MNKKIFNVLLITVASNCFGMAETQKEYLNSFTKTLDCRVKLQTMKNLVLSVEKKLSHNEAAAIKQAQETIKKQLDEATNATSNANANIWNKENEKAHLRLKEANQFISKATELLNNLEKEISVHTQVKIQSSL